MELPKETSLDKLSVRADASEKLSFDAPLNSKDVQEVLKSRFDSLDRDGNGFVTGAELIKGLNDSQYGSLAYRALYAAFKNVRDLEESSNDEWGDENDGITGKDINAISKEGKILDRLNQTIAAMNADAEGITDHSADNARVAAAGRAIREATRRDNLIDTGTDDKAITDTLANLSESDRHELKKFYKSMYGITLRKELEGEMSGSDLDKTVNLLARREGESDDAGFMHELLLEHGEWFGRSKKALSRALIDKVSTMSTADIERACREYRSRYGQGLENAFRGSGLGETTKASLEIYMKGADARGVEDTLALADQALSKKDLEMFAVSMRSASPEARQRFLEADGESRIKRAFGRPSRRAQSQTHRLEKLEASEFASTREVRHAMEFARQGRLSTSTLVQESTSWAGDNEKAIETALSQMSDSERKTYQAGRTIKSNEKVSGLNDEERQRALEFYEDLHNALDAAGNSTELARWEDHIFHKGGSLVGELAEHRGRIYDDSTDTIISSIENMDRKDWQRLKNDTDYRGQIEGMLSTYLTKGQMNRVAEVLDLKQVEKTYEESSRNGRRSVIDVIKDNKHRGFLFLDNKEEGIWGAIEKMTPEEKRRYREEPAFAEKLDRELRFSLDQGVELEIARSMLEKVRRLQEPEMEIFDKLGVYSRNFSVDEGKVVREVEAAFRDDPQLFKRVSKPENDEEREFSKAFKNRLEQTLDPADYQKYGLPLIEKGFVPVELHIQLNQSIFGTAEKGLLEALWHHQEKDRLSPHQRALLNSVLSGPERELARVTMEQGGMKDEDRLRSFVLDAGVKKDEIMQMMQHKTLMARQELSDAYARKYGGNATSDFLNKLSNSDRPKGEMAVEMVERPLEDKFSQAIGWHSQKRDGIGSAIIDSIWDGTGYQSDRSLSDFARAVEAKAVTGQSPSEVRQKEMRENLVISLANHSDSKKQFAEIATDGAIAAVAVGGAFFSAGLSLSLLAKAGIAGAAGAAIKIGGKAAIMNTDYDWAAGETMLDGGRGFLFASTAFLGPGELAHVLRVGNSAGKHATGLVTTRLAQLAHHTGERVLKEGAEETIERSMTAMVRHALVSGSHKLPTESLKVLAAQVALRGQEETVRQAIQAGLAQTITSQVGHRITAAAIEYGLPAAAGTISGGASGTLLGLSEMDDFDSPSEQFSHVMKMAGQSAAVGLTFSMGFKFATKGLEKGHQAYQNRVPARRAQVPGHGGEHVVSEKASERLSDKLTEIVTERIGEAAEHGAQRIHLGEFAEVAEHGTQRLPFASEGAHILERAPQKAILGTTESMAGRVNRLLPVSEPLNGAVENGADPLTVYSIQH